MPIQKTKRANPTIVSDSNLELLSFHCRKWIVSCPELVRRDQSDAGLHRPFQTLFSSQPGTRALLWVSDISSRIKCKKVDLRAVPLPTNVRKNTNRKFL